MSAKTWWGEFRVPMDSTARWRIGPLTMWIHRRPGEWRLAREESDEAGDTMVETAVPEGADDLWSKTAVLRYAVGVDSAETIALTPLLADRAVVAKPERTLFIPPAADLVLYMGSPLWVRLTVAGRELDSFPIHTPSETWFGPSTREGEICYATRTACRLRADEGLVRPHRATTAVRVRNHATRALQLDRIKIPVNLLSLYAGTDGVLWSQDVMLESTPDGALAPLQIQQGPPGSVGGVSVVSAPRELATPNTLARALSAWLPR